MFELLVLATDEFPQLCVGVREGSHGNATSSQQLKFDIIELNGTPVSVPGRRRAAGPVPLQRFDNF